MKREAQAFAIWRYGQSCDWDVSCEEIAEQVRVDVWTVRRICRERGWTQRIRESHEVDKHHTERMPVDTLLHLSGSPSFYHLGVLGNA